MYELEPDESGLEQMVAAHAVHPLRVETRRVRVNPTASGES